MEQSKRIARLDSLLSPADRDRLRGIYAPVVVSVQPDDARRGLCVMPDGEIRSYGCTEDKTKTVYLSSRNCGLDWTRVEVDAAPVVNFGKIYPGPLGMGAASMLPDGRYVTLAAIHEGEERGTYAMLSEIGPGDDSPRMVKITDEVFIDLFQPYVLGAVDGGPGRVITTGSINRKGKYGPTVFYSDDRGESWTMVPLRPTPRHEVVYPHLGYRWQNDGAEPNLTQLPDGRLMLLARTSLDYFYVYYSADRGETWTEGEQSDFHATLTTPYLLRLHDGRVVLFWNNTRPLAEVDHRKTFPPVGEDIANGVWEDVFTNRDANHAAVTEDGVHWTGFRELYLNERRNATDFRVGGSGDNSVQQFQALELPYGKILVAFGQHEFSRRTVIFDVNWLYERGNTEDFRHGLSHVSTHLFVKSVSGNHTNVYPGHCAWNRTNGALLMPDPMGNYCEALQIARIRDRRLVSELQGAVWNFPKAYRGEIRLSCYLAGAGMKVRLTDHWINPGDPNAGLYALFDFILDERTLPRGAWTEVAIRYDTVAGKAWVTVEERALFAVEMRGTAPNGLSYVHLQTAAEGEEFDGIYLNRLSAEGETE